MADVVTEEHNPWPLYVIVCQCHSKTAVLRSRLNVNPNFLPCVIRNRLEQCNMHFIIHLEVRHILKLSSMHVHTRIPVQVQWPLCSSDNVSFMYQAAQVLPLAYRNAMCLRSSVD